MNKKIDLVALVAFGGLIFAACTLWIAENERQIELNKELTPLGEPIKICDVKYERTFNEIGVIEYQPKEYCDE